MMKLLGDLDIISFVRISRLKRIGQVNRMDKSKGIPRQTEVALGVPGRLRPQIFSTFGTTRVVGRQPNAPAAYTPGEIPGTHFQRLSRPQGTWFCRKELQIPSKVLVLPVAVITWKQAPADSEEMLYFQMGIAIQ